MPRGFIEIKAGGGFEPAVLFRDCVFDENGATDAGGGRAWLEAGPGGVLCLNYALGGRRLRLTSGLDPAAEDRRLAESLNFKPGQGILCFGLGLGGHLTELSRRLDPAAPLWVLESRPALAAAAALAGGLRELFQRPGFRLFVGSGEGGSGEGCSDEVGSGEGGYGGNLPPWPGAPPLILWRPATRRHFASEYPLPPAGAKAVGPPLRRRRVRRALLFQSGYYLERELENAAWLLGLETAVWRVPRALVGQAASFKELLALIRDFRPDLVLTVNHLGFDAEGLLDELFTRLKLPAASWFVDSPAFILGPRPPSEMVSVFSWDRDYLELLKSKGFRRVVHLPLAADETFFRPRPAPAAPRRPVAFVGDSLTAATDKYMAKLGFAAPGPVRSDFLAETDRQALAFLAGPELLPAPAPLARLAGKFNLADRPELLTDFQALTTWRASRRRRLDVLRAQRPGLLHAAGDAGWRDLLALPPERLAPPLNYYEGLAAYYQDSAVNLNVTSAQMKTGLNQRVFDVPAAGSFLLTDRREQLFDLFEEGRETATYDSPDEAAELAAWFAARPAARQKIAQAALARVRGEHLYRHRLTALLAAMD